MSLVGLAQENSLPLIQRMDTETLKWIKKNSPNLTIITQTQVPVIFKNAKKYKPSEKWFLKNDCINSIHGIRHIMRVISNASNLTINRKTDSTTTRNLLIACSLHDLRRKDDKSDEGHAKRAVEWFHKNYGNVLRKFAIVLTKNDIKEVSSAIYFHEIPYAQIASADEYYEHKEIIDLLKTADALDRYRLPKLKWWIDDRLIKIIPSDNEKMFAYKLVVNSEGKYVLPNNSVDSVLSSLI